MKPTEIIGNCSLWLGDCREILPSLPKVDLVLTDPPYGIGESGGEKSRVRSGDGRTRFEVPKHEKFEWDNARPEDGLLIYVFNQGKTFICWGGNYFCDLFPPSMGWLYWDKKIGGDFSDGELAYTNRSKALRSFSMHPFSGLSGGKERQHPTQKPVALMEWCLSHVPDALTVCDPFMGSGTTGVACANMGKTFYGIEREPKYFEIACRRIEQAYAQGRLFA